MMDIASGHVISLLIELQEEAFTGTITCWRISKPRPLVSTTITVRTVCSSKAMKVFTPKTSAYLFILRLVAI